MHPNEIKIDATLVRRLLAEQFPQWADLPLQAVSSAGTDNALYRLGTEMVVRLPRISWALENIAKEYRWLPHLAPHLPLAVPLPVAMGEPTAAYPVNWAIYRWLAGENATLDCLHDPVQAARDLAHFIRALQTVDTTDAPRSGRATVSRGMPLIQRDAPTRQAIADLDGIINTAAATRVWEHVLTVPEWESAPVWFHGDIQSGNLIAQNGQLTAVIDFGMAGVGDPAVDLIVAWNLLPAEARAAFREVIAVDDATWTRGQGWALSVSVIALAYYLHTNATLSAISRQAINAVLSENA